MISLLRPLFAFLLLSLLPASAQVGDWFIDKAISYRQSADDTQPTTPSFWTIEVGVLTSDPGDAAVVSISRDGVPASFDLTYEDGEWVFDKNYASEAAMNAEFPSGVNYTITLTGGTLGTPTPLTQGFNLGPANYPNIPYLTSYDFTRSQSIQPGADFTLSWNAPGANATSVSLEVSDELNDNEVADYELDTIPLATSQTIAAFLSPGYSYEGYLSFLNTTVNNGSGGFGVEGYIEHTTNLKLDILTRMTMVPAEIVGAWQFGSGAENASGVLVFESNGTYYHAEDVVGDAFEFDGIERGTYSWDSGTGALTIPTPLVDTNGEVGLSHPIGSFTVTIDGDTLTIGDHEGSGDLQRVGFDPANLIEGAWRLNDNGPDSYGFLVFLDNGIYFHGEINEGEMGMERGTYLWNSGTGALTIPTILVDTNGDIGLSDPLFSYIVTITGTRAMRITDDRDYMLQRVTNARIFPDWRLNKARSYNQAADNTAPTTPLFWDVYAYLETRNATDAGTVTLEGGNLVGPVSLLVEDGTEWSYDKDYTTQGLLDAEYPDSQTYTITVSGGELGTITQEINMGNGSYPSVPYLTGTTFTDIQDIDSTADFDVDWNTSGGSFIDLILTSQPDEEGDEYFGEQFPGGSATGTSIPADELDEGISGFGYLEFGNGSTTSTGAGGFGVSGFSGRQSITFDFVIGTQGAGETFGDALTDAGLAGPAALPDATPFNDGVPNLIKFAFNMNLAGPDNSALTPGSGNSGLPVFELDDSGPSTVFQVEFIRRIGSGLTYTAQSSPNLGSFSAMTGGVTVTPIDSEFERVTVSEPCDPGTTPRCFGRVQVTTP